MLLYLIRHAEAGEAGGGVAGDFDRPLTALGRGHCRALAGAFARRGLAVDAVATSPLVRAYQTAAELLAVWNPEARPVTCDELAPGRLKPARLSGFLAGLPAFGPRFPSHAEKAVAAVGHMPDLGGYLEWLLKAAPGTVGLAKAAAACVRFDGDPGPGTGVLEWVVTPSWYSEERG
ncbi:MAG: protein phosphatase [Isosphaera sp.]|nr:protein phosphatase [Isosphaera sp.]